MSSNAPHTAGTQGDQMAKVQIKHRLTDAVLFEHETTDERMASGLAVRDAAEEASKCGANLSDADLRGANLRGAKWSDTITINRAPLQLYGLRWDVTILDNHMQIGCQLHELAAWDAFDDDEIIRMDGRDALRFWRAHKDSLLALARADGRGVTTETEAAHVAQ